ncbi:MAG: hypothetical protein WAV25_03065 [Minisyncoccia bacterium]
MSKYTLGALVILGVICGAFLPTNIIIGFLVVMVLFFVYMFIRHNGPEAFGIFFFLIPAVCFWAGVLVFLAGVGLSTRF